MASAHFLEEALSSDPDQTGMSAVVGSSVVLPPPAQNSLPVVTTSSVPVSSGVGGTTTLSSIPAPSPPTFINAGGGIGTTNSSSFQILNMNGLRASMQPGTPGNVQTVTTSAPASPKTLAPRMILSPQMIGVRPAQPGGVHECSSEFNKSNNDNQKESTDSNTDAFDTNECDDCILPTHIEDKAGTVLLRASQSPTQDTESEVLCLGELKNHSLESQSLVSPYPTIESPVEPDLFSCDPNASPVMASQARFQSDSSHCESPILNLDDHSHSDIIRFNSPENCPIVTDECVQKTNESGESRSEFNVAQSDQVSSSDHVSLMEDEGKAFFQDISGVQINDGLTHESASPNTTHQNSFSPNSLRKADVNRRSISPTLDTTDETFGLDQQESSQIHSRESILVPTSTVSISAQSKMQSYDALEETHLPSTTSAQVHGWARAGTENTSYKIRQSDNHSNLNECQSVNIPDISQQSQLVAIVPQPYRHAETFSATDHQSFAQTEQFPKKTHSEIPQVSPIRQIQIPQFSPTSKPQPSVSQFSPSYPQPQYSPSSHPKPQYSPSQHYHSSNPQYQAVAPEYCSTAQPRPKLSPSQPYPQGLQFSSNTQAHLPVPQLSPNAPNYAHFSPMSKDRQYSPSSGQIHQSSSHIAPGAHPYSTDRRFSTTSHHFPPSTQRFMHLPMDASVSQRQAHGQIFVPPSNLQPNSQTSHFRQSSNLIPQSGLSPQAQLSPVKIPYPYPEPDGNTSQRSPISPQYKNLSGSGDGHPNQKCFTTDAQLQSQYLHYNQAHPVRVQGNKEAQLSPSSSSGHSYHLSPGSKAGPYPSGTATRHSLPHHQSHQTNFPPNPHGISPRSDHALHVHVQPPSCRMSSENLLSTSIRSQQGSHLYDHQVPHVRPNLQHSPTSGTPYNGQNSPRWPSHSSVQNPASGFSMGVNLSNSHDRVNPYSGSYPVDHTRLSANPHANNPIRIPGQIPYAKASNNPISQIRPQSERQYLSNFSQGHISVNRSHSISGNLGSVRPIAQSSTTHAQFSSQYNQYRPENEMSNIYYRGQHHNVLGNPLNQMGSSSSGNYPVICRVSPIRNRLESNLKSSPPYHPYQKVSQGPSPSHEYPLGPRTQVMEYGLYQHDQYNERMRRLSTQFTLQALPRLPPGAQGGPHLLVKTESGQYQLVRFGMPAPALTARTGTPLPPHPTSPLTVPNSIPPTPSSPSIVTAMTTSNAQLAPSPSPALNALVSTPSSSVTTTTILGGLVQSQVIVTQPPLPGPVQTPSNVNFRSTNSPRPTTPVIISSASSANSNNTTVSSNNPSAPSQVSTGSPTLATTTTTYRLQTVPPVPPTAASNSNGLGMTASMSMQQQMHLPQVPQHTQALPSQAPSVLTSNNSTSTTASTVSQMTPDTAKTKCKNFLSFLLELSAKQNQTVARNVKALIQGLVDGKVNAEDFSDRLQKEVNSQPQPCLVGFLKKSLPPLRHSLATKELTIEGIRAPLLTSLPSGLPATPVTALIPQNQVRSPAPATPVKIITPISSSPSQPPSNSSAPIPRSTVAAVQQRFATPSKSPSSKASKAASSASSPTTQSHPSKGSGPSSKSTPKEKGDKKAFASSSNAGYSGDDDINDVAAMGGVNLAEESQRILGSTELIGTQIRSCKDEASLPFIPLQAKIKAIAAKYGLDEPGSEVAALISHALEERLKTLLEKLSVVAEHRLDVIKLEERYEVAQDVKGQLRFLEDLDKLERKRHDEQEREMLIRAAKSRSKSEDPEQAKLKAKAKEMQRVALEEMRQREANMTALQAIGPRKKPKLDTPTGSQSTSSLTPQSSLGASSSLNRPQMTMRPRLKRVSLRDLMFLLEQEKETSRSHFLYKHLLLK